MIKCMFNNIWFYLILGIFTVCLVLNNSFHCTQMLVYSLGMTLYWSVDFHLPQNQVGRSSHKAVHLKDMPYFSYAYLIWMISPCLLSQPVQLSDHLNSLLLSMCEDLAHRRVTLTSILEACESQHKASILPPPAKVIRQLVEEVFHESVSLDIRLQYFPACKLFHISARYEVCQKMYWDFLSFRWITSLCKTAPFLWAAGARWSERDFMVSMHDSVWACYEHIGETAWAWQRQSGFFLMFTVSLKKKGKWLLSPEAFL